MYGIHHKVYNSCRDGNIELIRLLIKNHHEEITIYDYNIGLRGACKNGNIQIIQLMIEKGANNYNDGLLSASLNGNMEAVKLMLKNGANYYNVGLYNACANGNMGIVQLMIEKGANDYTSGLYYACRSNHLEIIQLMIEKGANTKNANIIDQIYSFPKDKIIIQTLLSLSISLNAFERIIGYDELVVKIKKRENYITFIMNKYTPPNINNFILNEYILNTF